MNSSVPAWEPRSQAQRDALACPADILLFGGAAGSLKSETMLIDACAERDNPRLRGILFRLSFPELEKSLIRRSRELYSQMGAKYNEQKHRWTFPSGGTIEFGYCEAEKDIYRYQGAEYSFIGFDESTHFHEFPIRYMLSRLRSTEPSLFLRMRLASNPGNIGHQTHLAIFHGPGCTHCAITPSSRIPGELYSDAVWPSDKRPILKTTCFIPGRIHDHSLLGASYLETLAGLPGAFRTALLEGCWAAYEGQYFDNWDPARMVIRRSDVQDEGFWNCWVGADYGFNVSQAAAYLFARSAPTTHWPQGRTYVLAEYTAKHEKAADFARSMLDRFRRRADGEDRRIQAWYLSPDAWNQRGDGHTLADQMTESAGVGFEPASNDRIGGAMLIYSRLDRGELVICDRCTQLIEALPTRIHDPKRPDDILKIHGDPLDDCIDALRYGLYSYVGPGRTPDRIRVQQAVTSEDPTVAMLQQRLAESRIARMNEPHSYMGRPRR